MIKFMKYAIFFIILISSFSCTKFGKTYRVKGRVLNPITGQGIEGAEVRIYKNTMELPGGSKMQKSAITDSEGNFDMSKLAFRTDNISVYSFPGEYYPIGWTQNNGQSFDMPALKMGKTMHADFYAVPNGCALWHVKNVNCASSVDTMWYKIKYEYDSDFLNIWSFPYIGCSNVLSASCDKMKMGKHILLLKISRPSGVVYKYDTLFVNENGVTNYNLFY